MGVTKLWSILNDLEEKKPLKYLSGKRVAVDLSGWVVQAFQAEGLKTTKNPHLRNLFFRVSRLLKDGVFPIFVIEGDMPSVKIRAFKERNQQHSGKYTADDKLDRAAHDRTLLRCRELLQSLGVPCIKGSGEAEKCCAFLYVNGIVEGVITQDSDAFLYGADLVFRDFTIHQTDAHVNLYSLKSTKNKRNLNRKNLIALALLLGCDYDKGGVRGIGKESVMKLLSELPDCDLLQRFIDWKEKGKSELFPGYQENIMKETHCTRCDHLGSLTKHKKNGCQVCDSKITCYLSNGTSVCACDWHKSNEISKQRKFELKIYNATKKISEISKKKFPDKEVIDEYLCFSDVIPEETELEWKRPNLHDFQQKAESYFGWTLEHSYEKFLPIITSWHLHKVTSGETIDRSCLLLEPAEILKSKIDKGETCLVVKWKKLSENDSSIENYEDICTQEYLDRFSLAYPAITETFSSTHKLRKAKSPVKAKAKDQTLKSEADHQKITDFFVCDSSSSNGESVSQAYCDNTAQQNIQNDFNEPCAKRSRM